MYQGNIAYKVKSDLVSVPNTAAEITHPGPVKSLQCHELKVASKAFVKPGVGPPVTGHQVTKPLDKTTERARKQYK